MSLFEFIGIILFFSFLSIACYQIYLHVKINKLLPQDKHDEIIVDRTRPEPPPVEVMKEGTEHKYKG